VPRLRQSTDFGHVAKGRSSAMVLYHAISIYQLLVCICLRLLHASGKMAVCILPDFIVRKFPEYRRLKEYGFFNLVVLYPYTETLITSSMKSIEEMGDAFCQKSLPYSLGNFEEIYCAGVHFHFASYLVSKKIHFSYIEDGKGIWEDIEAHKRSQREFYPIMYEVTEANGLYDGSSPYIDRIYAYIPPKADTGEGRFADPRLLRFNVMEELRKLSMEDVDRICTVFGCRGLQLPPLDCTTIFLTDHAANMNFLTWEEQILRNTLTVDYFYTKSYLVIKPHPDDLTEYQYYFPDATVLPHLFPMELLMSFVDYSRTQIITFGSTSVNSMEISEIVDLCGEYNRGGFGKIHRLYAVWELYQQVNKKIICQLELLGINQDIFRRWDSMFQRNFSRDVAEGCFSFFCGKGVSFLELKEALQHEKSMIVLDELNESVLDIVRGQTCYFLPKCLEITDKKKNSSCREFLYILTADEKMMQIARKFQYRKHLKYTKELVEIRALGKRQERVMALSEILHATERRLLMALEQNARLKAEV